MNASRRTVLAGMAALPFLSRGAGAASKEGMLTFGLSTFPPNLQPWVNSGTAAATVKFQIFRGLLSFAPDGNLRGELASEWTHDEKGTWTFKLREALFHNGERVTSQDVKWTLEQIAGETSTAQYRAEFQGVQIETPDDLTVRITTRTPAATLEQWLAASTMPIISRTSDPKQPVGAGPYQIDAMERGSFIALKPWKSFYKPGLPKLKGLRFVAYPDDNLRVAALQSGDVDMIEYVPWQSMTDIGRDPKLSMLDHDGPFMYLVFNGSRPPFNDVRVRQAVAHGIKRQEVIDGAFFGRGSRLEHLPIPDGTPFYNAEFANGWSYDPDKSRRLLTEAGHPNGFTCDLLATAQYGMHKDTAILVQQHLAALGITANLTMPDWPTRVKLGNQGQYDIAVMGTGTDTNDPDGLSAIIDGSLAPSMLRSFGLKTPELSAMLQAGRSEFDPMKRRAIYRDVERIAIKDVPIAALTWRNQAYAMRKGIRGFTNMPGMLTFLSGITLETIDAS